jgi:hypothetical protein
MTRAERALLAKSRRGEEITFDDRLSVIDTVDDVNWFRDGLRDSGNWTTEAIAACARRKVEILRANGALK